MPYLSVQESTQTSITVRIYGLSYDPATYEKFRFSRNGGAWVEQGPGTGANICTFSGLSCGTNHSFAAEARWAGVWYSVDGVSGSTASCSIPAPGVPSISLNSRTSSSITLNGTLGSNTNYITITLTGTGGYAQNLSSNGTVTFSGLPANTTYTAVVIAYGGGGTTSGTSIQVSTLASFTTFSWGITITSGANVSITWVKWLEFQNSINSKRVAKGYGNYSFSSSSAGSNITATLANQLVAALATISGSVPSTVSSGSSFLASWLNQITDAYNNVV